jgi:Protein of unknown function (DUF2505)
MRFRIEQRFNAEQDVLCSALTNPSYLVDAMGQLPDIGAPVVESQERTPTQVRQRLQFAFHGSLPAVVLRVIKPDRLSWIEDTTVDLQQRCASFTITPVHYQHFFSCAGTWELVAIGTAAAPVTLRKMDGTLKVNSPVPFVGGQVERAIVSGLQERLAEEPAVFARWLAQQ